MDSIINNFYSQYNFEKVYVQFDNNRYTAGQTIWYKAYLLNGFQPSVVSKNFYIDWYDENGALIHSSITPVINSSSSGSFTLPVIISSHYIHAIAYTKWMRNFDSSYWFHQTIPLIVPAKTKLTKQFHPGETSIQFLPESGAFLAGKMNVIAFKAVNQLGLPESCKGVIKNSIGDSIAAFKSQHDGMGKFQLFAKIGDKYTATWNDRQGNQHQTILPSPVTAGVSLTVDAGQNNRLLRIQRTQSSPATMMQLTLTGQMNGRVVFSSAVDLTMRESFIINLPANKLPEGLLQLTVFDEDNQPLCERLLFLKNESYNVHAALIIDTLNLNKRAKNVFEIVLNDTDNTNLSIAVSDAYSSDESGKNIITDLLLQGDLKGSVYRPQYYFSSNADSVAQHLDLVMLTNGWRRFKWDEILRNTAPALNYLKDTAYMSIVGRVKDFLGKNSSKGQVISLIIAGKDSSTSFLSLPIADDGSFTASNVITFDSSKVYYQIGKASLQNDIELNNSFFKADTSRRISFPEQDYDTTGLYESVKTAAPKNSDSMQQRNTLAAVTVYSKEKSRIQQLDAVYAKGIFAMHDAAAAFDMGTLENAGHTQSIFDFLSGKVPGLQIGNDLGGTASIGVVHYRGAEVTFYLNEQPVMFTDLNNISVGNIAYIKVFSPPFVGGFNSSGSEVVSNAPGGGFAGGGAIAIYTKKGNDIGNAANRIVTKGLNYKTLSGYAPVKEFYAPSYAEQSMDNGSRDLRSTLLWNPWVILNKNNTSQKIIFYNNDITKSFRVVIEGMDSGGRLIHISKILK